jgi:hypothetical protein
MARRKKKTVKVIKRRSSIFESPFPYKDTAPSVEVVAKFEEEEVIAVGGVLVTD